MVGVSEAQHAVPLQIFNGQEVGRKAPMTGSQALALEVHNKLVMLRK